MRGRTRLAYLGAAITLAAILLAACGPAGPVPTTTAIPRPSATATLAATSTPEPPTPTPASAPTATAELAPATSMSAPEAAAEAPRASPSGRGGVRDYPAPDSPTATAAPPTSTPTLAPPTPTARPANTPTTAPRPRAASPRATSTPKPVPPKPSPIPPTATSKPASAATDDQAYSLKLHNDARSAGGVPPLVLDARISQAAQGHADDMAARGYFGHVTPEGKTPFDWMRQAGVSFTAAGENIGTYVIGTSPSQPAIKRMFDMMMAETPPNDGHRVNILNRTYKRLGVGVARSPKGQLYWVCDFAN